VGYSGRGLTEVVTTIIEFSWRNLEKPRKTSVRISGALTRIRTGDLIKNFSYINAGSIIRVEDILKKLVNQTTRRQSS
jgi:hypothetical protein